VKRGSDVLSEVEAGPGVRVIETHRTPRYNFPETGDRRREAGERRKENGETENGKMYR
jgi:hypothetical protein